MPPPKKKLSQLSQMTTWPLTPHQLRSHVQLYPRTMSNSVVVRYAKNLEKETWQFWRTDVFSLCFCRSSLNMYVCGISLRLQLSGNTGSWWMKIVHIYLENGIFIVKNSITFNLKLWGSNLNLNTSKHIDTLNLFSKSFNQRSMTPTRPLTLLLLRFPVWLYPRIIVSKSHRDASIYVDTEVNFVKLNTCTIIAQCTYYIYIVHTIHNIQNEWSHGPFWTKFRWDRNNSTRLFDLINTIWKNHPFCIFDTTLVVIRLFKKGDPNNKFNQTATYTPTQRNLQDSA